ncbi:hypothetical protein [Sphingopyxis macrogoltabida]|uniref:Uncharacterized protein n=1 Tax=Sphingopyxis macrogoltabida TaxID=33050 RepID=A0AAC9FGK0_SPHMC|nr:hypothetical protein [Sphingopyxis macrogoltabida]ALJ15354.1 hypothetical protein LH19_20965 [Sphingopyxis macrogoltabida]AMU91603.1 hypothetical protein ATM17_21545 [Sphingopyxis macrogoltabida]
MSNAQWRADCEWLLKQDAFRRFIFEFYRASGITRFTREEQQRLFHEGKRSLGLEVLGWFSATPAEPHDVIALAIEAGKQLTPPKGARHDDQEHPE